MSEEKEIKEIELRTEDVNEILTSPPKWLYRWGISIIFLTIVLGIVLSYFIQYPDTLVAKATLSNLNPPVKLVARTNGKLSVLLVKNNQLVKQGQVLAVIENTANYKDVLLVDSVLAQTKTNTNDFESLPPFMLNPLVLGELTAPYLQFLRAYKDYLLFKDINPQQGQLNILDRELVEYQSLMLKYQRQETLGQEEFKLIQKDYERDAELFLNGAISAREYDTRKKEFLNAQKVLENYKITISNNKITINNIEKNKLDLSIQHIEQLNKYKAECSNTLKSLQASIDAWKQNFLFISPLNGTTSFFNFFTINQNIKTGEELFSIVSVEQQNLVAKLVLPAQNSGKVKVGQNVNLRLDDYPSMEYGVLYGTVKNISLVSNNNTYAVDVLLKNGLISSYKKNLNFKEDMGGMAEIITENRSLFDRLVNKFSTILEKKNE